jgi:hypothetical protein
VHFTLVVVSAGLIILFGSAKTHNPANATRQLDEIISLKNRWSEAWVTARGISGHYGSEERWPQPSYRSFNGHWQKSIQVIVDFKDYHEFLLPKEPCGIDNFPNDLRTFSVWQSELRRNGYLLSIDSLESLDAECRGHLCQLVDNAPQQVLGPHRTPTQFKCIHELGGVALVDPNPDDVEFVIRRASGLVLDPRALRKEFPLWNDDLSDLAEISNGFENLTLEELRSHLVDVLNKGPAEFEAFGLRLPGDKVTGWGVAILLCIQFYLLIYLKQLARNLRKTDPGWDAPWIGMIPSFSGLMVFFASIVVLPVVAASLLCVRELLQVYVLYMQGQRILGAAPRAFAQMAGLALGPILSLILSLLCWKYRPRVDRAGPPVPWQLFE